MKVFVILLLPVILVLFIGSILSANSAFGLSCDATNMTWSFEATDAIFLGKALSKEYQPNPIREDRTDAVTLFSIIEPYKGIYQEKIKITSSEWHWGVNFTENSNYVVFANNNDGNLEHALCTPTQLASESNISEIRKISQNYILPPLVQSEFGVNLKEIQCKQNLVLIQKYDGSPACVKPETREKLIDRGGWGEPQPCHGGCVYGNTADKESYKTLDPAITIKGLKDTYDIFEPINFTVTIESYGIDHGDYAISINPINNTNNTDRWYEAKDTARSYAEPESFSHTYEFPRRESNPIVFTKPGWYELSFFVYDSKPAKWSFYVQYNDSLDFTNNVHEFQEKLDPSMNYEDLVWTFGEPDNDIGSGIHVYVYDMDDGSKILIGYAGYIQYAKHVDYNYNTMTDLIEK